MVASFSCALALAYTGLVGAEESSPVLIGLVSRVIDGDTIDVELQSGKIRVRLYAIDAPERSQPHGKEATAAIQALILDRRVQLEPFQQDRYQRLTAIVYLDSININAEMVRRGHAWAYRRYMRKSDAKLCEFEADARRRKIGLWNGPSDEFEAPWDWRNKKLKWITDFSHETSADCIAAIGRR